MATVKSAVDIVGCRANARPQYGAEALPCPGDPEHPPVIGALVAGGEGNIWIDPRRSRATPSLAPEMR
jgi:hypothetical protein